MKFGIVTFPGSNCDYDAYQAVVERLGEEAVFLWHKDHDLQQSDVIVLPGGFSYGDYLRAGAIARFSPVMQDVVSFAKRGGPVLAICNGFQIACEAGLLPGALLRNANLKFVCEMVRLRVETNETLFTNRYDRGAVIRVPIAHGDGRYTADEATLDRLEGEGRVVFRYVGGPGDADEWWSPNGSMRSIAGIVNDAGNVLGLMPHPERVVDPLLGSEDGLGIFESVLARVTV
ncbi:MAG TPA: phosphoribosylformylglycinamidine synthase subunit PurQ [Gemmatimonadaceae bacterium]|jgi:phosphoribosylformylglycinamidine synthase subunit PurQ / glutaminase|nr:phosphoribosylformylglycinamidine synthase subunit PurQ [Gemmatimonadaceae bacterium]